MTCRYTQYMKCIHNCTYFHYSHHTVKKYEVMCGLVEQSTLLLLNGIYYFHKVVLVA